MPKCISAVAAHLLRLLATLSVASRLVITLELPCQPKDTPRGSTTGQLREKSSYEGYPQQASNWFLLHTC